MRYCGTADDTQTLYDRTIHSFVTAMTVGNQGNFSSNVNGFNASFVVPFNYRVSFTSSAFAPDNLTLRNVIKSGEMVPARTIAFVDSGVARAWPRLIDEIQTYATTYADSINLVHTPEIVPGGEQAKLDMNVFNTVVQMINTEGICRHSYVLVIGGGAVLDAVGFAAATSHRGVRLVRFPTTTLSQGDSGVGVKNGINHNGKKNFLGSFAPSWAIVNDESFLTTLSDRDWRSGIAEAIKVALLKDAKFFSNIENHTQNLAQRHLSGITPILRRSAELHARHIAESGDPFEMQSSRPLDFGHWSAHKLEQLSNYQLRHGEAVAIGLALDTLISTMQSTLSQAASQRILKCIRRLQLPTYNPLLEDVNALCDGIEEFREHLGGNLAVTLLQDIGRPVEVSKLDHSIIRKAVSILASSEE